MQTSNNPSFYLQFSRASVRTSAITFLICAGTQVSSAVANEIVTGTSGNIAAHVKTFDGVTGSETSSFLPYGGAALQGVRVAAGDVTGDGTPDIVTALGSGAPSHVKVFSGADQSEVRSFIAYPSFSGGVYVAAGDINGDTHGDIITGAGTSATHVKVFSGATNNLIQSFLAYPGVSGGVRVAAGDLNGDGRADLITGLGEGFASHVKAFDGRDLAPLQSFIAYGGFTGGVYVAAGDVNGDAHADIITGAGVGGFTHVKVFSGADGSPLHSFFAYPGVDNEVRVGAGDVNGDGYADIITGLGSGNASHVKVFSGLNLDPLQSFFAYGSYLGGVYVSGVTPVSRVPVVPECSSLALACIGLLSAAFRRRASDGQH
jgi:hypothetical protein